MFADFLEGEITILRFNPKGRVVTNATLAKQITRQGRDETLKQLHATINRLNPVQAKQRLGQDGLNEVSNKEHHPKLHFLIDAFMAPLAGVLSFLAGLSFLTNYAFVPADQKDLSTIIIMVMMVLISEITSFIRNVKISDTVDPLLNMVSITINVR